MQVLNYELNLHIPDTNHLNSLPAHSYQLRMSHVKTKKEGFPRKNLAQDRLNRLREELKLKRKIEDEWEKFKDQQCATNCPLSTEVFINKFFPETEQVDFREAFKNKFFPGTEQVDIRETKTLEKIKRFDKTKISSKKTQQLKSQGISQDVAGWNVGDSNKLSRSPKKRRKDRKSDSFNGDSVASSSLSNPPSDTDVRSSNQAKHVKRKRGIADERLEKARKSLLKNCAKDESVVTANASATINYTECYMDVDMDVDMNEPLTCSNATEDPPCKLPDKWFNQKEKKISFFVDAVKSTREDAAYLAQLEECIPDVEMPLSVPSGDLLIISDTNIFLSHLKFLDRLLKSTVANYKTHVVVVPWVVIQEIDHNMKKTNEQLASAARLANHFISDNLEKPNFFGQSLDEFKINFKNAVSTDDFLLQYGLKLVALRNNVVLLSDDKNLCNKCMFCHLPAYTKDEFERTFDIRASQ